MSNTKTQDYRTRHCYFPMFASERMFEGEYRTTPEEDMEIWQRFDAVPPEIRDILTSKELPAVLNDVSVRFSLSEADIAHLSVAARRYYLRECPAQECGDRLLEYLVRSGRQKADAEKVVNAFKGEVLTVHPSADDRSIHSDDGVKSTEKLPLLSAIGKYPKLGEQAITEERIRVKNQSEPVRASLANWIRVYRDELGIGYHEPMLRGKFIFDSENGKRLSAEERERLNLILRSMEENVPLEIDSSVPAIVFPEFSGSKSIASPSRPNVSAGTRSSSPLPVASVPQRAATTSHSGSIPPQAPARKPVSFVPTPPADLPIGGGSFSFSSSHALPVEAEQEGDFSIRRPTPPQAVPSGQSAFGVASPSIAQASAPDMAAPDLNPFHIHPVSARKAPLSVVQPGNVVDLRGGNRKQV
ncbi:MAG: hypothetical protein HGB18_02625 [Candidatus Moranbacteria bacterium]|nr:hypothetical protein [Candidatus Moranbacteria bacterium]